MVHAAPCQVRYVEQTVAVSNAKTAEESSLKYTL
jgi:hypothetical protein